MLETDPIVPIQFKGKSFNAIVIDPDGLGAGKPTIGVGYRSMSRHTNVPVPTFVQRVIQNEEGSFLKLPSGKLFRVIQIAANDGNTYSVIEASAWVDFVSDWIKNPGRLRTKAKNGLVDFLAWYAAEGLYAAAYTFLKQTYTREDNQVVQRWLVAREAGKPARQDWSYTVAEQGGGSPFKYGKWTNYVYNGLFGMNAAEMKKPMGGAGFREQGGGS